MPTPLRSPSALGLRHLLEVGTNLAVMAAALSVLWLVISGNRQPTSPPVGMRPSARPPQPAKPIPAQPVSIATAAVKGSPTASVVIIEFSDFQCMVRCIRAKHTARVGEEVRWHGAGPDRFHASANRQHSPSSHEGRRGRGVRRTTRQVLGDVQTFVSRSGSAKHRNPRSTRQRPWARLGGISEVPCRRDDTQNSARPNPCP
jgi:hypothetical protein